MKIKGMPIAARKVLEDCKRVLFSSLVATPQYDAVRI